MRKFRKTLLFLFVVTTIFLSGCGTVDRMKVKFGLKNTDFEYIKQGKIERIVIQNTRDKGFRFVVTDKKAIGELYDILSSAKSVSEKSSLEPDYIFEMQESSDKIYKFNYIAGLTDKDVGNLYSDGKIYAVSKRIDNDIIKNFWNIRKPKEFEVIYYDTILKAIETYYKDMDTAKAQGKTDENVRAKLIGINLSDDVEAAKFILSTDLESFKEELKSKGYNAELAVSNKEYPITLTVKTDGYKLTIYKSIITFWDKEKMSENKYYMLDENIKTRWNINPYKSLKEAEAAGF